MTDPSNPLAQVPQKALKKIRALCQGNGAAADSIQIKDAKGEMVQFEALTHLDLIPETRDEKVSGKVQTGELLKDSSEVSHKITEQIKVVMGNSDSRKELANMLLQRPDKGFSLHGQAFGVPALNRDFSIYHACGKCQGQGQEQCPRCKGVRREICVKCHGKTMVPCQYCGARGTVTGPDGKPMQCSRCFGHKQVICTYCQKVGTISCQQCNATGAIQCSTCRGAAFYTEIIRVIMKIKTAFEIDRTTVPNESVKLMEDTGDMLVRNNHIQVVPEQIRRDDGGLAILYKGSFPFGDLSVTINGKIAQCQVLGYNAKFTKIPNILDGLTAGPRKILENAAKGKGKILGQINKARKTRIFGEALQLCLLLPRKKAMTALRKKYPVGISNKAIKHIIQIAYLALQNATKKSRTIGFSLSALMIALFGALYFLGPLRYFLLTLVKSEPVISLFDFALIPLGALLCRVMARQFAKQPLRKALGNHYPHGKQKRIKATIDGNVQSYLISATIFGLCVYGAKLLGQAPAWLPF